MASRQRRSSVGSGSIYGTAGRMRFTPVASDFIISRTHHRAQSRSTSWSSICRIAPYKRGGVVAGTVRRDVAADGTTMTGTFKGTAVKGDKFDYTVVYNRQQ